MAETGENKDIKKKKTAFKVLRWVGFIFLLALTLILTVNAMLSVFVKHYYPTFGKYRLFAIVSDSMEPEIPTGDMIVGRVPDSESEIEVGTVITYELTQGNVITLITHRVISVDVNAEGVTQYTTRGDNAGGTDAYRPVFDDVVGIYTGKKCGFFGYLFGFLQSSAGAIALIIILLIIALTWIIIYFINLVTVWRKIAVTALKKSENVLADTRIDELETLADVIGIVSKEPDSKPDMVRKDKKLRWFLHTGSLPKRPYRDEMVDDMTFLNTEEATDLILDLVKVSKEGKDVFPQAKTEIVKAEQAATEEVAAAAIAEPEEEAAIAEPANPDGEIITERFEKLGYRFTYSARLIQMKDESKEWYSLLKNELLSYKKVRSRISNRCETFMLGRKAVAKFTVRGKTLCLSLALDPAAYEGSKFSVEKGTGNTPCMYRIRSALRSRYAQLLIADLFAAAGAEKDENYVAKDYYLPYEGNVSLMERGLVKRTISSKVRKFKIIEIIDGEEVELDIEKILPFEGGEIAEETDETEEDAPVSAEDILSEAESEGDEEPETEILPEEDEPDEEVKGVDEVTGLTVTVRYKKSFTAKLIQSDDKTKAYYSLLKNKLLSYNKVKNRVSWNHENFNSGRNNIARFSIRGKTLCVYFALNPDDYEGTKYKVERAGSKKYENIPCLFKIRSARRAKYALDLIAAVAERFALTEGGEQKVNYYMRYESTSALAERGLIKELTPEEK